MPLGLAIPAQCGPAAPDSDSVSLAAFFEAAGGELVGTAYHYLGNREDAAEVFQDAFLKCWKNRHRIGAEIRDLRRWVFQVLVNSARDFRRRRRVRQSVKDSRELDSWADARSGIETSSMAGEDIERRELVEKLREAIRRLPEDEREVFLLRQNGGLAYAQIGDMLGIPEGTAKTRMRRALSRLREVLHRGCES